MASTVAVILSALSAIASVSALIGVLSLRREILKLRSRHTSEKMYFDNELGEFASKPEDLQRYRESIYSVSPKVDDDAG